MYLCQVAVLPSAIISCILALGGGACYLGGMADSPNSPLFWKPPALFPAARRTSSCEVGRALWLLLLLGKGVHTLPSHLHFLIAHTYLFQS